MKQRKKKQEDESPGGKRGVDVNPAPGRIPSPTLSVARGSAPASPRKKDEATARKRPAAFNIDDHAKGVLSGDRVMLGRTITLVESRKAEDNRTALQVLQQILPHTGRSIRIGITGVPGVGKSTFIEALGEHVIAQGRRLAVLAIDPSSQRSSGSIMGDKTRMENLSRNENAFIRPSPAAGSLGGVAHKTREAMLLCEAAGFDVVFIETVGVGQSETLVHSMVDFFLLLLLPNAGDQLQGIKRGIMELADTVIIHKADGENLAAAQRAKTEFEGALHLLSYPAPDWHPPVHTCSALTSLGIDEVWDTIARYRIVMEQNGTFQSRRRIQAASWMHDTIQHALHHRFLQHPTVRRLLPDYERRVLNGEIPALVAAQELLDIYAVGQNDESNT